MPPSRERRAAALVGRAREQAALRRCLDDLLSGSGRFVLIGGEAGVGKTTLVNWLGDEARASGADLLAGHCYDRAPGKPYGPWLDALGTDEREAADQVRRTLDGRASAPVSAEPEFFDRIAAQLLQLAAGRALVLILEDLHWADPTSLGLLRHVVSRLPGRPLLLVATYRDDAVTRRHSLFQLLPALVREGAAERIDLQGFDEADTRQLLAQRYPMPPERELELARHLQERTGGNPFYLVEVLRTLERERLLRRTEAGWECGDLQGVPVPPLVQQVIEQRLAGLDPVQRRLAELAAVIGVEVPLDVWRATSGGEVVEAVDALRELAIIVERPGAPAVRFRHALIQEALYQSMTLAVRRKLHRRVGECLAGRADASPSEVAAHFAAAEDPREVEWLVRTGEQALANYAAEDAVEALTQAIDCALRLGLTAPLAAFRGRGAAHAMRDEFDDARRDYETVLVRCRAAGDLSGEWQALVALGQLWAGRDYERAGDYCRAALDAAQALGDDEAIARSLNELANWHTNRDEPVTGLPLHQQALGIFERRDDRAGIADTLDLIGMAHYVSGNGADSTAHFERAVSLYRDLGDRQRLSASLAALAITAGDADTIVFAPVLREPGYWLGCAEEALAITLDIGWPSGEALSRFVLSMLTCVFGDLERALREGEAALDCAARIAHGEWHAAAHFALDCAWRELLQPQRAESEFEQALTAARNSGSRFWVNSVLASLASLCVECGELDRAAALLGAPAGPLASASSTGQRQILFVRAALALAREDAERALDIARQLDRDRPRGESDHGVPRIQQLRGAALAAQGRADEAEQAFLAARASASLYGHRVLLWRIDADLGELYRSSNRAGEAGAAFQRASALLGELAGGIVDDELRAPLLRRATEFQAAARPPVDAALPRLSPREREVLGLLVDGLTDREIADTLGISLRTANHHVASIFNKLGVNSRTAAAALAIRQELV